MERFFVGLPVSPEGVRQDGMNQTMDKMEMARVNAVIFNAQNGEGAHYRFDPEQYAFTRLRPFNGYPEDAEDDLLGKVCEEAEKRGMEVYSHTMLYENAWPDFWPAGHDRGTISRQVKCFTDCSQLDLFGVRNFRPCLNHPDYRQYYFSAVRDQLINYPLAGINFNLERNDPISHVLIGQYASSMHSRKPLAPVCFCPHCLAKARERGINIDRARQGWMELLEFAERSWRQALKAGDSFAAPGRQLGRGTEDTPPADGYFIAFLRILSRYPEIIQWNQMWYDGVMAFLAEVYGTCKAANPEAKLGLHIWHHRAMSVFERVGYDYDVLRNLCDWIKPKVDPVCAGFRYQQDIRRFHQALFYDLPIERAYDAWNTMLGFIHEAPLNELPKAGMSLDYLRKDVEEAVKGVRGQVPIYPGIGLDMPTPARTTEPENVRDELWTIYEAGAEGVVLSRALGEMRECNLRMAGETIAEIDRAIKSK